MITLTNHGSIVPLKTGLCVCGHKEADHIFQYWPTKQMLCRAGSIDPETGVGLSCVCCEYRELQ